MDTQYSLDLDGQSGPISDNLIFYIRAKPADNELGIDYAFVLLRDDEEVIIGDSYPPWG